MTRALMRLIVDEDGQGMTEYALILAFVVILVFLAFTPLASGLNIFYNRVIGAFSGTSGTLEMQKLAPAANWDQGPVIFKA